MRTKLRSKNRKDWLHFFTSRIFKKFHVENKNPSTVLVHYLHQGLLTGVIALRIPSAFPENTFRYARGQLCVINYA